MSMSGQAGFHENEKQPRVQVRLAAVLPGHGRKVDSVCFSPDGSLLAIVASDDCVRLWDVGRSETVAVLEPAGVGIPSRISFSSDGKLLAASVGLGRIAVWLREGHVVAELGRQVVSGVTEAVFSPRDKWLVSGDRAGFVHVWDVESRKHISLFPGAHNREINGIMLHWIAAENFTFTGDGKRLAFESAGKHGKVQVWEIDSSATRPKWVGAVLDVKVCVFDIAFSPDGRVLAVSDFDHDIVHLFDGQSLVPKGMLNIPDDTAKSIAFSPDSRYLATGGGAGTVWIWKMATQQMVASFAAHTEGPDYRINSQKWALGGIDWSPDGKLIATSGIEPATVKLWEIRVEE